MSRILLIDDSTETDALIRGFLPADGPQLETAREAGEGLDVARSIQPELIFINLALPGIPSWRAIREIKRDLFLSAVPVVALSSATEGGERERALAAGCDDFLAKPISREAVERVLSIHLAPADLERTRPLAISTPAVRGVLRARILLASADADFLHLYSPALQFARYRIETVASGHELFERIESARPHLVILDSRLSDRTGAEAAAQIKARQRDPFLPILLLTEGRAEADAGWNAPADDFLAKPFPEPELKFRVRKLLLLSSAMQSERDRSRQLATVARYMTRGLLLVDGEGRITLMNRPCAEILGSKADPRGRAARHLLRSAGLRDSEGRELPADFNPVAKLRKLRVPSLREIYAIESESGQSTKIEIVSTAIAEKGKRTRGAILLLRRIGEDAEAQRELHEAYERLMEVDQLKSKFLSTVSHELRTPLNTIILLSHILTREPREGLPAGKKEHDLQVIQQSATTLLHMINNLLDLARIEAGQAELTPENLLIEPFLKETLEILAPQAESRGLRLRLAASPAVPERAAFDREKVRQILLNLISNAIKFTPRGSVELGVAPAGNGNALLFSVRDEGLGIPPDKLSFIFEPFRRISPEEGATAGSGLGLSIVKELVRLMGGEISVESQPGHGSTFRVLLPIQAAAEDPHDSTRPARAPRTDTRVLVVEDDENSRDALISVLALEGYGADPARDGKEAVSKAQSGRYDAIFMDISLPDEDGTSVIEHLRRRPETRAVPIIALTGKTSDPDRRKIEAAGASAYLSKPVDVKHLLKTLSRLLDAPRAAAERG